MHDEVTQGQLLAGKYRIERVLGQGGMGVVVAAHHLVLDQVVAIKFLLPQALNSAEAVARFEREARAAVKIQSEHVARVTDVGRLETGAPYMVMELLRGRDLGDLLQQEGPLPLEDVADYILQAGEAIAEAHGLGIVHRDLKPPNLFLTTRADGSSCVKVLDFGISKVTGLSSSNDQSLTSTTAVMGSPLYMSPEQLLSARDVDMTTDIWALGVICYELLTGKPPFIADTLPQLCMAISTAAPTPLRTYRPDLPVEMEQVLARCLEKDRGKRIATVAELASELVKFAPRRSRLSAERIERLARAAGFSATAFALPPSSDGQAVAPANPVAQTLGAFGRTRPEASSNKWGLGLTVGAVVAIGAMGVLVFARQPQVGTVGGAAGSGTASMESWTPPSASGPSSSATAVVSQVVPSADGPPPSVSGAARPPPPPGVHEHTPKLSGAVTHPPSPAVSVAPNASPPRATLDCDIPYFYDSRGNKVFKKGCL
jgi:serine/threonine protein kinase